MIGRLRAVKFRYNEVYRSKFPMVSDGVQYSFIAQEYREVFPGDVKERNGYLTISTASVTPHLVGAVQELVDVIDDQQRQIDELKALVDELVREREAPREPQVPRERAVPRERGRDGGGRSRSR